MMGSSTSRVGGKPDAYVQRDRRTRSKPRGNYGERDRRSSAYNNQEKGDGWEEGRTDVRVRYTDIFVHVEISFVVVGSRSAHHEFFVRSFFLLDGAVPARAFRLAAPASRPVRIPRTTSASRRRRRSERGSEPKRKRRSGRRIRRRRWLVRAIRHRRRARINARVAGTRPGVRGGRGVHGRLGRGRDGRLDAGGAARDALGCGVQAPYAVGLLRMRRRRADAHDRQRARAILDVRIRIPLARQDDRELPPDDAGLGKQGLAGLLPPHGRGADAGGEGDG